MLRELGVPLRTKGLCNSHSYVLLGVKGKASVFCVNVSNSYTQYLTKTAGPYSAFGILLDMSVVLNTCWRRIFKTLN